MNLFSPYDLPTARDRSSSGDEVWTPTIVGSGVFVSNLGRLLSEAKGVWTPKSNARGYVHVHLTGHGKAYVHWLVIASFEGVLARRRVVRENGDKTDNRLCNLSWSDTTGTLSKEEKESLEERLREGRRLCQVAREFGLLSSHVAYYKRKLKC